MRFPLVLIVCVLCGCVTTPTTIKPPADNDRKVHIDERLLKECEPLTSIKDNPQPSDVLDQHKQDVLLFNDCATGKRDLIQVIRKAFE